MPRAGMTSSLLRGLSWYAKRLRVMSAREIAYRFAGQASLHAMRLRHALNWSPGDARERRTDEYAFCAASRSCLPPLVWGDAPGLTEAGELIAGRGYALGFEWRWRPDASVWHTSPDTAQVWPRVFFGAISYRQGNPYGDVRVAWEPSRLQHLVSLALIVQGGDEASARRATHVLEEQFLSWVEANPPMTGIHYISAMECALRVIAACHALDLVRGRLAQRERIWDALVRLVANHAWLIERRLSRYSSANNHLIAEAAGLVYAGTLFPEFSRARAWREQGLSVLEGEATRQILRDGGGVEQAFWYLLFVADLYGLVIRLLQHGRHPVPQAVLDASQRARNFLNAFADSPGGLPAIGDSDGGYALSPLLRISWERERPSLPRLSTFRDAGYSLINAGEAGNATLLFDHGPLGLPPSYAHGHADALSVLFRIDGQEVLIDPGTYAYNGPPTWRSYFRGTSAHNTVAVDSLDQARQETTFLWSNPFVSDLALAEESPRGVLLLAHHDGYLRTCGVLHWRAIIYRPPGSWAIWDYLAGEGEHALALNWHTGMDVERRYDGLAMASAPREVRMVVEGGDVVVTRGATEPPCGWKSPLYGVKEPSTVVQVRYDGPLPHEFLTRLIVGGCSGATDAMNDAIASLRQMIR